MDDQLLTTREAATLKAVSRGVIWNAVQRGDLIPVPRQPGCGRGYRFRLRDVTEWIPPCERPRLPRYTDDDLMVLLCDLKKRLARRPYAADLDGAAGYPSVATYRRRFGSWRAAQRALDADNTSDNDRS